MVFNLLPFLAQTKVEMMNEKFVKNATVCERLGVSNYQRLQLIEEGLLERPIEFGGAYPRHTEQQIVRAQKRIADKACSLMLQLPSKPLLSEKQRRMIRENANHIRVKI